ncbi:MAG: hypothetical protein ACPG31_10890 [Planctomycetota bacterium]
MASVLSLLPAGAFAAFFDNPLFFLRNDGGELLARIRYSIPGTGNLQFALVRIDAATGQAIGLIHTPPSLSPWSTDAFDVNNLEVCLLGDIDRDGYNEIGVQVYTPSTDPGGHWPNLTTGIAILAPPTIDLPTMLSLGTSNPVNFDLPSAGGMPLVLVCSTNFEGNRGLEVDSWPSNLWHSPLLDWSRSQLFLTALDGQGGGSIQISLPNHPALIGQELYFRGIVWDPSAPFAKVWTMSSLGRATAIP